MRTVNARPEPVAIADSAPSTHAHLVNAILSDGLTTRDVVTETSGRGVGLAALQAACMESGALIDVTSVLGQGCRFGFRFPRWA